MWSSVGLPIILKIGFENFEKLLSGANEIDNHFKNEPYDKNIPIILACLGVLYNNYHSTYLEIESEIKIVKRMQFSLTITT